MCLADGIAQTVERSSATFSKFDLPFEESRQGDFVVIGKILRENSRRKPRISLRTFIGEYLNKAMLCSRS
jgi:hypothetical protein